MDGNSFTIGVVVTLGLEVITCAGLYFLGLLK